MKKFAKVMGNAWTQRAPILAIIFIIMAVFAQKFFLPENFRSILIAISLYGVMACGMLFVILIGGIDLCVGSTAALASCVMLKILTSNGNTPFGLIMIRRRNGLCVLLLFHASIGLLRPAGLRRHDRHSVRLYGAMLILHRRQLHLQ
jgi:ribose/xylose/arabinose/galactoside ABC-type transport system permease subunit